MGEPDKGLTDAQRQAIDRVAKVADLLRTDDFGLAKIFESNQNFYEKLLLLNSGTLTLLFTVVGGLANHPHSPTTNISHGHNFMYGCWLLLASIVGCIAHNHVNISALYHSAQLRVSLTLYGRLWELSFLKSENGLNDLIVEPRIEDARSKSERALKDLKSTRRITKYVGLTAQALTIVAFVQFVIFINSNLSSLLP